MKYCNECGKEIKSGTLCDDCRREQRNSSDLGKAIFALIVIAVLAVVMFNLTGNFLRG